MSSACGKVVMVVGIVVALALMFVSVLNIGLYGGAMDLDVDNCQGPCRERTGALGIVAGVFGFLVGIGVIVVLVLPLVVPAMAEPLPSLVAKLVLLVCLFLVVLFYIVAWSLMAKDINDFRDAANGACDDMAPDVWNASASSSPSLSSSSWPSRSWSTEAAAAAAEVAEVATAATSTQPRTSTKKNR
jgi:hypothetical protein